ncbi:HK97 family phage prohead protease [Streptomyces sp. NPDC012769]|uniref:HK97 family phage prohead protease n=1 Tax=Streptomyces sp. NPDC012769 TaxID=3364848 RepID=UPI0036769FF5
MERKSLSRVELKDADQGIVSAAFSTFDVIDLDGDVTRKSAFKDGSPVKISAYNHGSWEGALPVGKGVVRLTDREAICDMQFFMKTQAGRETFEIVKEMGQLQEWSWGFNVTDSEPDEVEGKSVRVIKSVDIFEVSPVLVGAAGPGRTRTLAVKAKRDEDEEAECTYEGEGKCTDKDCPKHGKKPKEESMNDSEKGRRLAVRGPIPFSETDTVTRAWDGAKTVKALPEDARPSELRTVFAWVDPDGDPEAKSSYAFAHHHGVGGQANLRACLQGIAKLNSDDPGVPERDREAVYKHLSSHLLDADREPPKLRTAEGEKGRKRFNDEAIEVMAAVSSLIDRAAEVVALRAQKNRGMAPATADLLSWLEDDLLRMKSLLETPVEADAPPQPTEEEVAAVLMAGLARLNEL